MPIAESTRQEVLDFCDRTIDDAAIHALFNYDEVDRWEWASRTPATLFSAPIRTDCSGYATMGDWQTSPRVPDPSKTGYSDGDYTGTLLACLNQIGHPADVLDGDFAVFGPDTGDHVVIIRDTSTRDFKCASHGHQGDPSWVTVSEVAASVSPIIRYLRNDVSMGPPPLSKGSPAWQLAQQGHVAPMGLPPTLTPGSTHKDWDLLARRVLHLYGDYELWLAPDAGWGHFSADAMIRWERTWNANPLHANPQQQFAPNGIVAPRHWAAWGFTW